MKISFSFAALQLASQWPAAAGAFSDYIPSKELVSADGILEVTLTVDLVVSLDMNRTAPGYNGISIGPTLRVKPGDTLRVTLINDLPDDDDKKTAYDRQLYDYVTDEGSDFVNVSRIINRLDYIGNIGWPGPDPITEPFFGYWGQSFQNLHFHGMEFDPRIEENTVAIPQGETKIYEFQIPEDHSPGTNWYHNHVHGTNGFSMMSGLYGMIIVEDTGYDITEVPEIAEATEVPLFLSETKLDQDGYPMSYINIVFDFSWVPLANGQRNPEWHFASNETVLFRAVSASVEPAYFLSITPMDDMDTKIPIVVVTRDGFPVTSIEEVDSVTIDAGSRSDLLVKFDVEPGTYLLRRAPWNLGITGVGPCLAAFMANVSNCISYDREETFATIVVEETPVNPPRSYPPQEVPPLSPSLIALLDREVDGGSKTVVLKQKLGFPIFQIPFDDGPLRGFQTGFGINELLYNPHYSHGSVVQGTCEEWLVVADPPGTGHTFHIHGHPFVVSNLDGMDVDEPFFRDTMPIGFNATIKVCFDRHDGGNLLVHCHMPIHQDLGMGGFYTILSAEEPSSSSATIGYYPAWEAAFYYFIVAVASFFAILP